MAIVTQVTEKEYRELALNDQDASWELWDGVPRRKPPMSAKHDRDSFELGYLLRLQLDRGDYMVNVNGGKTRVSAMKYFIPDVVVIPMAYVAPFLNDPRAFNAHAKPFPFVAEVWSPSTGDYDVQTKLNGYRERGDAEIWYLHPFDRVLKVWRKQPDGSYVESTYRGGVVSVESLPGVAIDLDDLLRG